MIHIEDMFSFRDLSCATHKPFIGVPYETPPKIDTQCAYEGPEPAKHSFPSYPHKTPDLYFAKLCHSQNP
jgi:hypothetical protein